ncbi:MAG: ComF family protein [Planctomycetota bacterium]|jgi:ComF family protein
MEAETQPFEWPPSTPVPDGEAGSAGEIIAPEPVVLAPVERPRVALWRQLEETWLEPTVPALGVRMIEAGWEPDAPCAYCNRCGVSVGGHEQDEFGCASCRDVRWPWDRFVRLGEYDGVLREWIHEAKFRRWRAVGVGLGRMLGESLRLAGCPKDAVVVAVPMARSKRMSRGIDHTRVLASGVREATGMRVVRAIRARRHRSQRLVASSERVGNVRGVFRARAGAVTGGHVALVDDVRTSGATLASCARVLREECQDLTIWACGVGVAPEPGRAPVEARV